MKLTWVLSRLLFSQVPVWGPRRLQLLRWILLPQPHLGRLRLQQAGKPGTTGKRELLPTCTTLTKTEKDFSWVCLYRNTKADLKDISSATSVEFKIKCKHKKNHLSYTVQYVTYNLRWVFFVQTLKTTIFALKDDCDRRWRGGGVPLHPHGPGGGGSLRMNQGIHHRVGIQGSFQLAECWYQSIVDFSDN